MQLPRSSVLFLSFLTLSSSSSVVRAGVTASTTGTTLAVCQTIRHSISKASVVNFPNDPLYALDIQHTYNSSSARSVCSVEPGSLADLSTIIKILGRTKTRFGLKGGGHAGNPFFSSSNDIQIAMSRFDEVTFHPDSKTVDIGTGQIWDNVYDVLAPLGVNVAGGRVSTVGVAGFTLGGGYSWFAQSVGLAIDTVTAFELVLPNGVVTQATATKNSDLFFGLKGGLNNFGIVTKITYKTFPQGPVWAGVIQYANDQLDAFSDALADFSANNTDPNAASIAVYQGAADAISVVFFPFYNGSSPPPGVFDKFLAIPSVLNTVTSFDLFSDYFRTTVLPDAPTRATFDTFSPLQWSRNLLAQFENQTRFWTPIIEKHTGTAITYSVEPFMKTYFDFSKGGAYPHDSSLPVVPLNFFVTWNDASQDQWFYSFMRESIRVLEQTAVDEGQNIIGKNRRRYPNYALFDTPLEELYGGNLPKLKAIKKKWDPENVMGLTGGFKL